MPRLVPGIVLAALLALSASPAFAQPPEPGQSYPEDRGAEARQDVGQAAREAGSALRRGWERTKEGAHETGAALAKGWHTIESGVRWGWNHPHGEQPAAGEPDTRR